ADANGDIIYVNQAASRIFGYAVEELIGEPVTRLAPGRGRPLGAACLPSIVGRTTEVNARRKDGSEFPLELSLASWTSNGGVFYTGIMRDLTPRRQAEDERIIHALRQRDALVREVHHRIKNHLQGIAGLLRNRLRDDPAARETIEAAIAQLQSVAAVYGL